MPSRNEPIVTGEIYHIFNKTIDKKSIFINNKYCTRFLDLMRYYRSFKASVSYSKYLSLSDTDKSDIDKILRLKKYFAVDILCYSLMPTHFHILLKQKENSGISTFISNISSSLSHYYNIRNERKGPLFLPQFKSVLIENDEQLIHVSRYIHLNPYSSSLVKHIEDLLLYPWSSYRDYMIDKRSNLCKKEFILSYFAGDRYYKKFVEGNAEHQKMLEYIKHTIKWI